MRGLGERLKGTMSSGVTGTCLITLRDFLYPDSTSSKEKRIGRKEVIRVSPVFVTCSANRRPTIQKNSEQFACTCMQY